jgi:hypothetical protein
MVRLSTLALPLVLAAVLAASACLPNDTRPVPASVLVRLTGSPMVKDGIPSTAMDDGWSVTFEKFLVTFGNVSLQGDACTGYSDAGYVRTFDAHVLEPQKVSLLYALGTCSVRFRFSNPAPDSPLGAGVTDADNIFMRTPGTDPYNTQPNGISIYVKGSAQKGSVKKTFAWPFRSRRAQLTDCTTESGGKPLQLVLDSDGAVNVDVQLHGEALFQDHLEPSKAKLRFAPFADADDKAGNGDGEITLDELGKVTLDSLGFTPDDLTVAGQDAGPLDSDAGVFHWTTLEDYLYLGLFPRIARLGDRGSCIVNVNAGRGG